MAEASIETQEARTVDVSTSDLSRVEDALLRIRGLLTSVSILAIGPRGGELTGDKPTDNTFMAIWSTNEAVTRYVDDIMKTLEFD